MCENDNHATLTVIQIPANTCQYVCMYYIMSAFASGCAATEVLQLRYSSSWPVSEKSNTILDSSINRINLILFFFIGAAAFSI